MSRSSSASPSVLVLSGSLGAGKSAVGVAIHDVLSNRSVPHAFLDLDALAYSWPPSSPYNEDHVVEGVRRLWPMYQAAGAQHLVLARVIETRDGLERYAAAVGAAEIVLCRLTASEDTRIERLRGREYGETLKRHLARTVELESILERAALEDFVVANDARSLPSIAEEVLVRAGWIDGTPP